MGIALALPFLLLSLARAWGFKYITYTTPTGMTQVLKTDMGHIQVFV